MVCPSAWTGGTVANPVGQQSMLMDPCMGPPDSGDDAMAPPPAVDAGPHMTPPTGGTKGGASGCAASRAGATAGWYGMAAGGMLGLALAWRRARRRRRSQHDL
jgi:hypothetical protein